MKIPKHCLDQLLAAGLLVSKPYIAARGGVTVAKPATVPGNSIPGYECHWGWSEGIIIDAPCVGLQYEAKQWVVTVHEYIPGPGPGDFVNRWDTPEQAVADVLDYLLGDPVRMQIKQRDHAALLDRLASLAEGQD
jgi:hypothetical protein